VLIPGTLIHKIPLPSILEKQGTGRANPECCNKTQKLRTPDEKSEHHYALQRDEMHIERTWESIVGLVLDVKVLVRRNVWAQTNSVYARKHQKVCATAKQNLLPH